MITTSLLLVVLSALPDQIGGPFIQSGNINQWIPIGYV